jgi:hypothetical protein
MRRVAIAISLIAALLMASCATSGDENWARQADDVIATLADAYDLEDSYQTARFFSAGGTLDLSHIWGGLGVATTPAAVVDLIERIWFWEQGRNADVAADHLFLAPDGAIVWWYAYDLDGFQNWMQSYGFRNGRTSSIAFRALEVPFEDIPNPGDPFQLAPSPGLSTVEEDVLELAYAYVAAWGSGDRASLSTVYTDDVSIRDDVRGTAWSGLDDVVASVAGTSELALGPWPAVFVYESDGDNQAVVLFQLGGDCPMLEARRWVFDGQKIVRESRFTHVPSARRCLDDLPDGWWSTFELPGDLQNNVTEIIDAGGSLVDLVNAEPSHEEFSRWLVATYSASGLGVPDIAAVWYPPAPECDRLGGLAIEADERYDGRHTVVVCFGEDELRSGTSESGWTENAIAYGLHEFAHIWMVDRLDDATRAEFNEHAGLTVWRGSEAPWHERGVEHAAFTISWGVTGNADARYPIAPPAPPCEHLARGYQILTGRTPVTTCGEGGWSP